MIREHFEFRQTIATILADEPRHVRSEERRVGKEC